LYKKENKLEVFPLLQIPREAQHKNKMSTITMLKINFNRFIALNGNKIINKKWIPYSTAGCDHIKVKNDLDMI
jgi:hypothetical protein